MRDSIKLSSLFSATVSQHTLSNPRTEKRRTFQTSSLFKWLKRESSIAIGETFFRWSCHEDFQVSLKAMSLMYTGHSARSILLHTSFILTTGVLSYSGRHPKHNCRCEIRKPAFIPSRELSEEQAMIWRMQNWLTNWQQMKRRMQNTSCWLTWHAMT